MKDLGTLDINTIRRMIATHSFDRMQSNRYYVALSLEEAESLRGVMHMRRNQMLIGGSQCAVALRFFVGYDTMLFDATKGFVPAYSYQQTTAEQCYRFLDSQVCEDVCVHSVVVA